MNNRSEYMREYYKTKGKDLKIWLSYEFEDDIIEYLKNKNKRAFCIKALRHEMEREQNG